MSKVTPQYGIFSDGIPYAKFGIGEKKMVVFQGGPGNEIQRGFAFQMFAKPFVSFCEEYTIFFVTRKSALSKGYTTRNMSDDYARMIEQEFNGKVDVLIGISYGGFIIQHFAVDYPEMADYFIVAMASYKGSEKGMDFDMEFASNISKGKPAKAYCSFPKVLISNAVLRFLVRPFFFFMGAFAKPPKRESYFDDIVIEAQAEVAHNTKERLPEIKQSILILCGNRDYYMPLEYLLEMEQLIPNAKLKLYPNKGHNITTDKQFPKDIADYIA